MTELKPCPFCGGEAEKLTSSDGFTSIGCLSCNPIFGVMIQRSSEAEAIAVWNTRADDYRQAVENWQRMYENTFAERTCQLIEDSGLLHCSECGGVAEERLWAYWHYCPNCGARVRSE